MAFEGLYNALMIIYMLYISTFFLIASSLLLKSILVSFPIEIESNFTSFKQFSS